MNGQQLYEMYRQAMSNEGFDIDQGWDDLGDAEKNAWDEVAAAIGRGEQEVDAAPEEGS